MKRFLALLMAMVMVFALAACGKDTAENGSSDVSTTTSDTATNESTDDNEPSTTSSEAQSNETESSKDSSTVTTSKPQSSDKPVTSSKDNTTSSTPSTSTSKPDTETTDKPTHTHEWSSWKTETKALVGKDGTEKRTCSSCKETEIRTTTKDAAENSFLDNELNFIMFSGNKISGGDMITYFSQKYEGRDDATINPSSATVFNWLSTRFVLTDTLKQEMKQDARYNNNTDTFTLSFQGNCGDVNLLGYVHNSGNKYTVYYSFDMYGSDDITNWKVELEYNLLNGNPNKYLSVEKVDSAPANITK